MRKNQYGFAHIAVFLVILVIVVVGAAGWFVFDRNKKPKTNNTTQTTQQTVTNFAECAKLHPVTASYPSQCTHEGKLYTQETGSTNIQTQKYLELTNLGIKIPLSTAITDAYYEKITAPDGTSDSQIGVKSLDGIASCKPRYEYDSYHGGYIFAGAVTISFDIYDAERINHGGNPDESRFKDNPSAVRIGNNWYEIGAAGSCKSTDPAVQQKISVIQQELISAGKKAIKL